MTWRIFCEYKWKRPRRGDHVIVSSQVSLKPLHFSCIVCMLQSFFGVFPVALLNATGAILSLSALKIKFLCLLVKLDLWQTGWPTMECNQRSWFTQDWFGCCWLFLDYFGHRESTAQVTKLKSKWCQHSLVWSQSPAAGPLWFCKIPSACSPSPDVTWLHICAL